MSQSEVATRADSEEVDDQKAGTRGSKSQREYLERHDGR